MGTTESKPTASLSDPNHPKSIKPYGVTDNTTHIKLNTSYRTLYSGILDLIQKTKYSDRVIICGGDRYPIHRAIVCPRSTWFEDRCELAIQGFDYSSPASPMKIWIDPSECEPHVLAAVLTFLYTLDYASGGPQLSFGLPYDQSSLASEEANSYGGTETGTLVHLEDGEDASDVHSDEGDEDTPTPIASHQGSPQLTPSTTSSHNDKSDKTSHTAHEDPSAHPNQLVFHAQMYMAGQRFGIPALSEVAKDKFQKRLRENSWRVELLPCIREVYRQQGNGGTANLKDEVVKSAKSRFRVLKQSDGWDALVMEFPEFAANMLKQM